MAEVVVATLNVSFDSDAESTTGNLKLEIDDRPDGSNSGNTSFKPGDIVGILQFKDDNIEVSSAYPAASAGSITTYTGFDGVKTIDENITFSNSDTSSLGYPPSSAVTMNWLGKVYEINASTGVATPYTGGFPDQVRSELTISGGKKIVGILNCKYTSTGTCYKLTVEKQVATDFKEVLVFSVGTVTVHTP